MELTIISPIELITNKVNFQFVNMNEGYSTENTLSFESYKSSNFIMKMIKSMELKEIYPLVWFRYKGLYYNEIR